MEHLVNEFQTSARYHSPIFLKSVFNIIVYKSVSPAFVCGDGGGVAVVPNQFLNLPLHSSSSSSFSVHSSLSFSFSVSVESVSHSFITAFP